MQTFFQVIFGKIYELFYSLRRILMYPFDYDCCQVKIDKKIKKQKTFLVGFYVLKITSNILKYF